MIAYGEARRAAFGQNLGDHGRSAMAQRVLHQVSHQPRQKLRIAVNDRRHAADPDPVARAFLGCECEQVDRLDALQPLGMIEAAGEQYLLDQRVEFTEILDDLVLRLVVRRVLEKIDRHAQAGEWRAEFVAGIRQQGAMRLDHAFDAVGRLVEGRRDGRDLVGSGQSDARRQRARAPALDAVPQLFQAAREMAHNRVGGEADRGGDEDQPGERASSAGT